ncbi:MULTISPECIES: hypothetical protein [Pseudomonas]|nr:MULTISPECIES: hypothetical protein [Pseudomonas]
MSSTAWMAGPAAQGREAWFSEVYMFDWNRDERCQIPILVTNLPADVPSPVKLTPWKESGLKVLALHRRQGFITAKQIAAHGVGITAWTQAPYGKKALAQKRPGIRNVGRNGNTPSFR